MNPETESEFPESEHRTEANTSKAELIRPTYFGAENDSPRKAEELRTIFSQIDEEIVRRDDKVIKTIATKNRSISIDTDRLNDIKEKYGVSDWEIQVDPKFSFRPSRASWKDKTLIIRSFNIWSYISVGASIEKRNDTLSKLLAHELRHAQQKAPDDSLKGRLCSVRHLYWFHPLEVDARKWSDENWEEFDGIIRINHK